MKKIISLLLVLLLVFAVMPIGVFTASAATSGTTGDCIWSLDGTVLTISGNGEMGDHYYNSLPWGNNITKVIIEDGVTSIGVGAFSYCSSLTSITIPEGVTSIGNYVFYGCSSLTSINIPDSVTSIGEESFIFCNSLKDVYITDIGAWCNIDFGNAYSNPMLYVENLYLNNKPLTEVTIPEGIIKIGDYAFCSCDALMSITIPDSVTSIGRSAFQHCSSLTSITIPDGVTSIDEYAFSSCSALTKITIPDSLTSIGNYVFRNCSSLTSITIPNGVANIGNYAFSGCGSLTKITISDSVKSIGDYTFSDCSSLTSITIPNGVANIGNYAFSGCGSLTKITISDSVKSIGDYTFSDCSSLTSITIPDGVTSIGNYVFENCDSLTRIAIPDSVTSIGIYAFHNCSSLTKIIISDSVKSIGDYAFSGCNEIISVTVSDGVTTIGDYAFENCRLLTSITIPDSVTSIGEGAFSGCRSLKNMILPFVGNKIDGIENIHFGYIFGASSYSYNSDYVPSSLKEVTITKATSIGDSAFKYCGSLTSVTVLDGVKYIGNRAFSGCSSLTSITIPNSVTSIGVYAFSSCRSLTSINIPDGVTSIDEYAFSGCSALTKINIPDSVVNIGNFAFYDCNSLKDAYITDIGDWCNIDFGNAYSNPMYYADNLYLKNQLLTDLEIPDNAEIVNSFAFYNCKTIESIFIPESMILIKQNAFYNCSGIENVYFEGTAQEWAEVSILSGNDYLKNATVYYNSTGIPGGITSVEISKLPDKMQYIENEETLDLAGGVLTIKYDGGATKDIDLATLNVEGFDNSVLGKQSLTVKYGEFSAEFEVEVIMRQISFVAVSNLPQKTVYTTGDSLDLTGGKLAVGYPEGRFEIFDITAEMVTGFDSSKVGLQVLTVNYRGFTDQILVTVYAKANPDVDGDGSFTVSDVVVLRNEILSENNLTDLKYDINGDGKVDARDIVNIKRQLVS